MYSKSGKASYILQTISDLSNSFNLLYNLANPHPFHWSFVALNKSSYKDFDSSKFPEPNLSFACSFYF